MGNKRNCPTCGNEIVYKSLVVFKRANKFNSKCKRCALKGRVFSDETRKKMSQNACDRSGDKNPNYGKVSPNRGKKIEDFMSKENAEKARARLSKGIFSGFKHSAEAKESMANHTRERNLSDNPMRKKDARDKVRQSILSLMESGIINKKSSIELKMATILDSMGIGYISQKKLAYWCFDFYLPDYDIYIECDGDYWHANEKMYDHNNINKTQRNNIIRGKAKDTYMKNRGLKLLRFWESDINNNPQIIENAISILKLDKEFINV